MDPLKLQAFGKAGTSPIWYHGRLNRAEVEARLSKESEGTYLFRDSSSGGKDDFVLSVR